MNRRITLGLLLALMVSLGLLSTALAHAKLVSSDPAAGAKLTKAPAKVTLVFSEEISDKESDSNFTVTDESGATVGTGKVDNTDLDHKTQVGTLKDGLGDGIYTVKWNALTPDDQGHSEGSFSFGVNKDPGAQPTAKPEPTAVPTAAGAAAQPTAAAHDHDAAQPTAAAHDHDAAGAANLPKTGENGADLSGYFLIGAVILLASGLALRRGKRSVR
jgi:methionine-rich copper-binding protein CopC